MLCLSLSWLRVTFVLNTLIALKELFFRPVHDMVKILLLHEYRDLFIDMDVRNNRSELAIANRHQER